MAQTMYEANGVGLAAPQVGISERVIVVDVGDGLIALINPEICESEGNQKDVEGCLSIPGVNGYVCRAARVVVQGTDENGRQVRQGPVPALSPRLIKGNFPKQFPAKAEPLQVGLTKVRKESLLHLMLGEFGLFGFEAYLFEAIKELEYYLIVRDHASFRYRMFRSMMKPAIRDENGR